MTPTKRYNGTFIAELCVWLLMLAATPFTLGGSIFVAVAYSLWRVVTKYKACTECHSREIVPIGTPAGERIIQARNG